MIMSAADTREASDIWTEPELGIASTTPTCYAAALGEGTCVISASADIDHEFSQRNNGGNRWLRRPAGTDLTESAVSPTPHGAAFVDRTAMVRTGGNGDEFKRNKDASGRDRRGISSYDPATDLPEPSASPTICGAVVAEGACM